MLISVAQNDGKNDLTDLDRHWSHLPNQLKHGGFENPEVTFLELCDFGALTPVPVSNYL